MSSFNRYFESELAALRHLGREFANENPSLAPFLSQPGKDPDIERLFEGFAFLTGRLRQKLDDELPELSHSLMQILWPNYMRPLPACTMIAMASGHENHGRQLISKGTEVVSNVAVEGVECQFRTCHDVVLHPLKVRGVDMAPINPSEYSLTVGIDTLGNQPLSGISLSSLRLHLCGDRGISEQLYLMLLEHVKSFDIVLKNHDEDVLYTLPALAEDLSPGGFSRKESLLPYPLNTYMGYRIIQEYFYFPEAFMFIDVNRLDRINRIDEKVAGQAVRLELVFKFENISDIPLSVDENNVRLFCTPAVNLFDTDAMPIRLDRKVDEYAVHPVGLSNTQAGVYSIDSVLCRQSDGVVQQTLHSFESFRHEEIGEEKSYYNVRQRARANRQMDTWLRFAGLSYLINEGQGIISVEMTCSNQDLPRHLDIGDICLPGRNASETVEFTNITRATPSYPPSLEGENRLWKVISNMSLNYLSLANIEALRTMLEAYDFASAHDVKKARETQHRLKGLCGISHRSVDRLFQGMPIRGVEITLEINPEYFMNKGGMYVFSSVLNEFFTLYSSINSFHVLCVKGTEGSYYRWKPRMGEQPIT